jgi:hypothetical protein
MASTMRWAFSPDGDLDVSTVGKRFSQETGALAGVGSAGAVVEL